MCYLISCNEHSPSCVHEITKRFPNGSIKLWEVVGNDYEIVGVLRMQVMRKNYAMKVHEKIMFTKLSIMSN